MDSRVVFSFNSLDMSVIDIFHSIWIEDNIIYFDIQFTAEIPEGYYGVSFLKRSFKIFTTGSYYIVTTLGHSLIDSIHSVGSKILVDKDALPDDTIILGGYISAKKYTGMFRFQSYVSALTPRFSSKAQLEMYQRSMSPVFYAPPFPISDMNSVLPTFHSVISTTDNASAVDVMLSIKQEFIPALGNLVVDLPATFRFESSGWIILRSRFVRYGLSIYVCRAGRYILVTNNSSLRVPVTERIFQYCPLSTFQSDNHPVSRQHNIICNWNDPNTNNKFLVKKKPSGMAYTNTKKRQDKSQMIL